ncbi:MAG: TIGR00730 family Rossman fold protein [Saprospiraceae bacterium]
MKPLHSISIFCGSSTGNNSKFAKDAHTLGTYLAKRSIQVIYGGAKVGLMGTVADAVLQNQGKVIGVMPVFLQSKEIAHDGLTELKIVQTMHERKTVMDELSDGAIVLPGGFGTLDEMFELLTWGQLGLHKKPIAILNTDGFYDELVACLDKMVTSNLLRVSNRKMLIVSQNIEEMIRLMEEYEAPLKAKWMDVAGI